MVVLGVLFFSSAIVCAFVYWIYLNIHLRYLSAHYPLLLTLLQILCAMLDVSATIWTENSFFFFFFTLSVFYKPLTSGVVWLMFHRVTSDGCLCCQLYSTLTWVVLYALSIVCLFRGQKHKVKCFKWLCQAWICTRVWEFLMQSFDLLKTHAQIHAQLLHKWPPALWVERHLRNLL